MADSGSKTYVKRKQFVDLAREQLGCHYVHGAAGNTPGMNDGAWYRPSAVKLHKNCTTAAGASNGRKVPIYQAAYCEIEGMWVCGGRCDRPEVIATPKGDMDADIVLYDGYRWPRPDGSISSSNINWGESCEGIRHFDCIGFVNWCLAQVARKENFSIPLIHKRRDKAISEGKEDISFSNVRAGDFVLKGKSHIGIASGDGTVIHASGYKRGVIETNLADNADHSGKTWDIIYRLSSYYWT